MGHIGLPTDISHSRTSLCLKPKHASRVRFALDDDVHIVERFSFGMIRGDLRHPDYSTIGQCRHKRLSAFAEDCALLKMFTAWVDAVREEDSDSELSDEFEFDDVEFDSTWFETEDQVVEQEL